MTQVKSYDTIQSREGERMNKNLLKSIIYKKGLTIKKVAEMLGITRISLSIKISGKTPFSIKDIKNLRKILGLTDKEIIKIFID